jgi:diphthamide biosynthesis protein 3
MSIYEEVEIEDLDYDPVELLYTYPCPCGDKFRITLEELWDGEDIAPCPSCTLRIEIIYDEDDLPPLPEESDYETDEDESADEGGEEDAACKGTSIDEDLAATMDKALKVN